MKNRSKPRRARRAQKAKKTLYRKDAPLRTFPIEVRNMIYRLLLTNSWEKEQTHVRKVLAGLRGDPGLYKEALIIFYETNIFCLTEDNHWLQDCFVESNGVRFMDTSMIHLAATWEKVYVKVPIAILATGPLHGYVFFFHLPLSGILLKSICGISKTSSFQCILTISQLTIQNRHIRSHSSHDSYGPKLDLSPHRSNHKQ